MSSRSNQSIAKRHQSFPGRAILPGEDRKQFEALFDELWSDLNPSGPVERSLVVDVAYLTWRKSRLDVFRAAEAARKEFGECFADGDLEAGAFRAFQLRREKEQRSLERRVEEAKFLDEIKPKFADLDDIVETLQDSLRKLNEQNGIDSSASRPPSADAVEQDLAKQREAHQFAILGDLITPECFIEELEFKERLDEAIERAVDRLAKYQARRISGSTVDRRGPRRSRATVTVPSLVMMRRMQCL